MSSLGLRASCRGYGGAAFELDAGSGLGQAGAALASDVGAKCPCAWPHLRERGEDGLRAARLDGIRGVGYIESCVGGILKFFKRTYVVSAVSNVGGFLGRAGPARLRFLDLGGTRTPDRAAGRLCAPFSARQVSGRSGAEGFKRFHEARLGRSVRQTGGARTEMKS